MECLIMQDYKAILKKRRKRQAEYVLFFVVCLKWWNTHIPAMGVFYPFIYGSTLNRVYIYKYIKITHKKKKQKSF